MSRFKQLKERRIVQILISYLAAAWVGLEVLGTFVERGRVPQLAWDVALMWAVAGFGAALLIGWYHGERGKQKAPLSEILALSLLGLTVLGFSSSSVYRHVTEESARQEAREDALKLNRIAVLYFDDLSPDGSARYIADGLTESLIDELSTVRKLDVVSRTGVAPFRGRPVNYDTVAERLDPGTIVTGSVEPMGGAVRVGVRLVDRSGTAYQRASFDVPTHEILNAQQMVVDETARLLREWLRDEVRVRRSRAATSSAEAWALYHRGEEARKDAEEAVASRDREGMAAAFDRADSLLALAADADPDWREPQVLRAYVAYQRSRAAAGPDELLRWVAEGLERIRPVLEAEPNHARALEIRGTLKYWRRIRVRPADPEEALAAYEDARSDLERAVEVDPGLATAHASLTHVYLSDGRFTDALLAGQRAYEEDAFLENADVVVHRNHTASYNLQQFTQSRRWCDIGQERFPDDYRFAVCELILRTTPAYEPDPDRAWELLERIDRLSPARTREYWHLRSRMVVGGVLALADMADSARAVWRSTRDAVTPEVDPTYDIPFVEAYMRTLAGDDDEAIDLLKQVAAALPGTAFEENWWWRGLRSNPRWGELQPAD